MKFALFDRALPLSQNALALVNAEGALHSMSVAERLAAALITELERLGETTAIETGAAISHAQAAAMLARLVTCTRGDP